MAYRDDRTAGIDKKVYEVISEDELYARTGKGICVIIVAEMWIYAWINQFLKEKYTMKYMR